VVVSGVQYSQIAEHTILTAKEGILDSSSITVLAGVDPGLSGFTRESPNGTKRSSATKTYSARLCGLNSEGLSHDGAATSNGLQIGHAATTTGGGREGSKSGGGRLLQERAHGLRLTKHSVHGWRIGGWRRWE
jgi:hypothetical protein